MPLKDYLKRSSWWIEKARADDIESRCLMQQVRFDPFSHSDKWIHVQADGRCKSSKASKTVRVSGRTMLVKSMRLIRALRWFSRELACRNHCFNCAWTVCSANLTCSDLVN